MREILIRSVPQPQKSHIDHQIEWLCHSFGLLRGRDTSFSAQKIVEEILFLNRQVRRIPSQLVAKRLGISRDIVNHHVRHLSNSGLVEREKKKIVLRGGTLCSTVEHVRRETNQIFDEIMQVAQIIDNHTTRY